MIQVDRILIARITRYFVGGGGGDMRSGDFRSDEQYKRVVRCGLRNLIIRGWVCYSCQLSQGLISLDFQVPVRLFTSEFSHFPQIARSWNTSSSRSRTSFFLSNFRALFGSIRNTVDKEYGSLSKMAGRYETSSEERKEVRNKVTTTIIL